MLNINRNKILDRAIILLGKAKSKPKPANEFKKELNKLIKNSDISDSDKLNILVSLDKKLKEFDRA